MVTISTFSFLLNFVNPLARGNLLLLEVLLSVPIDVSGLPVSLAPSLGYTGQKEISGTCHSIIHEF